MSTRKDVRGVSDRATSSNLDSKTGRPVPSSQPTVSKPLSGCRLHRTRSSNDNIDNPIEYPKASMKYNPPFRRNLRYFGYPEDLNMAIDTPPKVHSWGPLPEVGPKTDKYANEGSAKPNKRRGRDEEQIPAAPTMNRHYMGRLLKKNLLLDNPGLLPAFDRAIIPEGSPDKLQLLHPDFEVTNCPSQKLFPISETAGKAFCKIHRLAQEKLDQRVKNYKVENSTVMKVVEMEQVLFKNEEERSRRNSMKSEGSKVGSRRSTKMEHDRRKSSMKSDSSGRRSTKGDHRFSIVDTMAEEDKILFDFDMNTVSPAVKALCMEKAYPELNYQFYGRPKKSDDDNDYVPYKDEPPKLQGPRIPNVEVNIPDDIWVKLAKVRQRQHRQKETMKTKWSGTGKRNKFRTFTQLQLRNRVMKEAREGFIKQIKTDSRQNAPLPPELFQDNRYMYQPVHDYLIRNELPPQGPFRWKIRPEEPPTKEELEIVENSIKEAKAKKTFTHHLPGLTYEPRSPFKPIELDWIERGAEEYEPSEKRKLSCPSELHLMPEYMLQLDKEEFDEKFEQAISEGVKELIGKEMWDLYRRTNGIVEEDEQEEEEEEPPKVKKYRRKKRAESVEEEEDEEEGSGEDEEKDDSTTAEGITIDEPEPEPEPDHTVSNELLDPENLPLAGVRYSKIQFPSEDIPEDFQDDLEKFKTGVEAAQPVKDLDLEEGDLSNSDGGSDDSGDDVVVAFKHDPQQRLETIYQDAVQGQAKNVFQLTAKDLQPPNLKDIFLLDSYIDDIEYILKKTEVDQVPPKNEDIGQEEHWFGKKSK